MCGWCCLSCPVGQRRPACALSAGRLVQASYQLIVELTSGLSSEERVTLLMDIDDVADLERSCTDGLI
jgi:hypothetical protein